MYYNIKIKSNGSEFSLESNNKEITQREMDMYFACIFDVSEEFKSKIKKVEVTNQNVKSIQEIEKIEQKTEIKNENTTKEQEDKKSYFAKPQEVFEFKNESITEPKEEPSQIIEIKNEKQEEQKPSSEIKFQNETKIINIKDDISLKDLQNINSEQPSALDDISQLISLAQEKIDSLESLNKTSSSISIKNDDIVDINPKNNKEQESQAILNDIFNTPTPKPSVFEEIEENNVQTPQIEPSALNDFDYEPDISLADIEISLQNQEEITNTPTEEIVFQNEVSQNIQTIQQNEIEEIKIEPQTKDESIATQRISLSQRANQVDFKPFLSGFICDNLSDKVIVCAYFIKNVLRQPDFTMKYINSKLFQATGEIADLSIIDELITKEYIRIIDSEEGKKYCITMDGESYFAEKFQ